MDNECGLLDAEYISNISGAFKSGTGSTLRVLGIGVGSGDLTFADGFTNNGTIELTDNTAGRTAMLTVTTGTLVNAVGSSIDALPGVGGGARTLTGALNNLGTISVETPLRLNNTFTHADNAVLQGTSTLNVAAAAVTFNGDIEPGTSGVPGVLSITDDLVLGSTANVSIDIDGTTVGTGYDQLAISGNVTIGGTLNLNREAAFIPALTTVFNIMTYGSRTIRIDFATTNGENDFNEDRRLDAVPRSTSYDATVIAWPK